MEKYFNLYRKNSKTMTVHNYNMKIDAENS